jgi:flagellar biosynthesis chaperone FliJ
MQDLREIALLLAKSKGEVGWVIPEPQVKEFYTALANNQLTNDAEAAQHFFQSTEDLAGYQKLKQKLRKSLLNALFLVDFRQLSGTPQQLAYFECQKEWAAAKLLLGKSAKVAAVALAQKVLKDAVRYEFTDLALQATSFLRQHYGNVQGDTRRFEQYNAQYKHYEEIWRLENHAEELYIDLIIKYVNKKATNHTIHEKAKEYYDKLKNLMQQYDAYRLHLCGNLILNVVYSSINDYENTIKMCDEAIAFFASKTYDAHLPLQIFYCQKIICYTQLKAYQQGKEAAERCLAFVEEGSYNWFKLQELYIALAFHSKEYQSAYTIFSRAVSHSQFPFLSANVAEMWKVYEAYVHYLILLEQIQPKPDDKRFTTFRLNRFLNETPHYSKDKRGMNIPILIVQIVLLIHKKQFTALTDKMDAIEKYCSRYLRHDDTFRSNCIIRMLLQIPAARFHPAGVARKVQQYLEKLKTMPLDIANQTHEIEIIPYEDLWHFVTESLDHTFQQPLADKTNSD